MAKTDAVKGHIAFRKQKNGFPSQKEHILLPAVLILSAFLCLLLQEVLIQMGSYAAFKRERPEMQEEYFREMELTGAALEQIYEYGDYSAATYELCRKKRVRPHLLFDSGGCARPAKKLCRKLLVLDEETELYERLYRVLLQDIEGFPVKKDPTGQYWVSYGDSWGGVRTYGGKRRHEGCDLMADNNERGYFEVVSVSRGVVEKKGWLEQGGYRIGIRSPSGAYFYYAHLSDYAPLEVGDEVEAGTVLGHMGDTGYSKVEGTTGNFDVHLHFGMYLDLDGKETAVNPYHVLKYIEEHYCKK